MFLEPVDIKTVDNLFNLDFSNVVKSSYAPDRVEKWYGYCSNLQSIKNGKSELEWKEDFPDWLAQLRDKYYPGANSSLLCAGIKPDTDTSIDWHRDHGHFENEVVMINFGKSIFYLQTYDEGTKTVNLKSGDVVKFDSKLLHKSSQTSQKRYIITFRKAKREFTSLKLF